MAPPLYRLSATAQGDLKVLSDEQLDVLTQSLKSEEGLERSSKPLPLEHAAESKVVAVRVPQLEQGILGDLGGQTSDDLTAKLYVIYRPEKRGRFGLGHTYFIERVLQEDDVENDTTLASRLKGMSED